MSSKATAIPYARIAPIQYLLGNAQTANRMDVKTMPLVCHLDFVIAVKTILGITVNNIVMHQQRVRIREYVQIVVLVLVICIIMERIVRYIVMPILRVKEEDSVMEEHVLVMLLTMVLLVIHIVILQSRVLLMDIVLAKDANVTTLIMAKTAALTVILSQLVMATVFAILMANANVQQDQGLTALLPKAFQEVPLPVFSFQCSFLL